MTHDLPHPSELRLASDGSRLEVAWDDGERSAIAAPLLRAASRSAGSVRLFLDDATASASEDVSITDVEMVGAYAVRLFFSDGHDRGIYPWRYLRDIGAA